MPGLGIYGRGAAAQEQRQRVTKSTIILINLAPHTVSMEENLLMCYLTFPSLT